MTGRMMHRFHLAAVAAVAVIGFASVVSAADLPVKAPFVSVVAPAPTWAGTYIGTNIGWDWQNANSTNSALPSPFAVNFFALALSGGAIPNATSQNGNGVLGGFTLGHNFQNGSIVYGVEADATWLNISKTSSTTTNIGTFGAFTYFPITTATQTKIDWLSTLRARAGLLVLPQTLLYATGGFAVGRVNGSTSIIPMGSGPAETCSSNGFCSLGSGSETKLGLTIGGGAEYMLASHWTVKIEYLYYDLGHLSYTANEISSALFERPFVGDPNLSIKTNITGSIVRAGVNLKF